MNRTKKRLVVFSISILVSILIYLTFFIPGDFTEFNQQLAMFSLMLIFPLILSNLFLTNKHRAFWIASLFFIIGLLFLYRGFYMINQFYLLDYIFYRDMPTVINTKNVSIYREPLSLWWVESVIIYLSISILGLMVGYFAEKKKGFLKKKS